MWNIASGLYVTFALGHISGQIRLSAHIGISIWKKISDCCHVWADISDSFYLKKKIIIIIIIIIKIKKK